MNKKSFIKRRDGKFKAIFSINPILDQIARLTSFSSKRVLISSFFVRWRICLFIINSFMPWDLFIIPRRRALKSEQFNIFFACLCQPLHKKVFKEIISSFSRERMCIFLLQKENIKTAVRRDTSEYANTRLKFQRLKSSPLIKKISKQFLLVSLVDLRALNCLYQISLINSPYSTAAAAQKRENIFFATGHEKSLFLFLLLFTSFS